MSDIGQTKRSDVQLLLMYLIIFENAVTYEKIRSIRINLVWDDKSDVEAKEIEIEYWREHMLHTFKTMVI